MCILFSFITPLTNVLFLSLFLFCIASAGPRNETYDILGANHVLRISAGATNKRSTAFGLTKNIQKAGGDLNATSTRETISYNVELTRDNLDTGLKFLQDASTQHEFRAWEIEQNFDLIKYELNQVSPHDRAVDLLHKAAFRTGLGNSVNCAKHHIGKISSECLQHYVSNNLTSDRAAVVAVGINHQLLLGYAKNLSLQSGSDNVTPSKYHGLGDLRVDKAGELASVAIATQGASLANEKEALAFAVLQQVAGVGSAVQAGNLNGALGKKVAGVLGNTTFNYQTLNGVYTDNGLFGFVLTANARQIGKVITKLI